MKTKAILSALMLIGGATCFVSCNKLVDKAMQAVMENAFNHNYEDSEKWGKVVTVDLPTVDFHEVELSGAVRLEYRQDSTYSVQAYGPEKAIAAYIISTEDGELEASQKEGGSSVNKDTPAITLRITAPYLTEVKGAGASEIVFTDSLSQDYGLDINLAGAGKLSLGSLKAKELDVTLAGAGEVRMDSVCCEEDIEVELNGAAGIRGKLTCRKLKMKMAGAGEGKLDIYCQQARVSASGSANLTLTGECHNIESTSFGSSSINKDGLN